MLGEGAGGELYFCGSEIFKSGENKDPRLSEVLSEEIYTVINKPALEAMFQEKGLLHDETL